MIRFGAVVAVLCAQALAMYALAELIAAGYPQVSPGAVSWWGFVGIALAGYGLPRAAEAFGLEERRSELLVTIAGCVLVFLAVRVTYGSGMPWDFTWATDFIGDAGSASNEGGQALAAGMLLGALWLYTVRSSVDGIDLPFVPRQLGLPLAGVTGLIILGAMAGHGGEVGRAGAAFYAFAVVGLAGSQLGLSGVSLDDREAGSIVGALVGGTVGMVVVGLILVTIVLGLIGPIVGPPLATALNTVLTIILTPIAWVLEKIFNAVVGDRVELPKLQPSNLGARTDQNAHPGGRSGVAELFVIVLRAVFLAALAAGAYYAARFFTQLRKRRAMADPEANGAAASGSLREDLGGLLRGIFRRGHDDGSEAPARTRMAKLYHEVLDRSERQGRRRAPAQTPSEFAPELRDTFQAPVTDEITRAFEHARYAGRELDPAVVDDLERRWRTVR